MRGLSFAIEKGGKILTSGSIPSLIEQSDLTSISHYTNMADHYAGNLYVGGMNADKFKGDLNYVISGLTWSDIQAKQQKINPLHSNKSPLLLAKLIDEGFTTNVSVKNLMIEADKLFGSEDDGPSQGH